MIEEADDIDVDQPSTLVQTAPIVFSAGGRTGLPEPVARIMEDGLVDLAEQDPDHLLDESSSCRYAERSHATVGLGIQR